MITRKLFYNTLVVAIVLMMIAGCAGGATQTTAPTAEVINPPVLKATETKSAAPAEPTATSAAAPAEPTATTAAAAEPTATTAAAAPAEGSFELNGVTLPFPRSEALVMDQVNYAMVESFNDWIPNGEDWAAGYVQIANEALWYVNYVTGEVVPWLAESMEYSADYKTWTLHIKKGITWNDGQPFTANDIVYTLETLKGNPKLGGNPDILAFDKVSAPDDFTMVVNLTVPTPRYHELWWVRICTPALTQIVPKHIWEKVDPLTFKNYPPVTTGAYKLFKTYPEQKIYVWVRRDDYWNKTVKPGPKYVIYRSGPAADQMVAEAKANKTDVFGMDYKTYTEQHDSELPQINVVAYLDPCPRGAFFNNAKPPLDKPEFRRAMSMLMNRPKWAANIWIPPTKPAEALWADYRNMDPFINKDANTKWATLQYSPDKAKELLTSVGYKFDGGKMLDAKGTQVKLEVIAIGGPTANEFLFAQDFVEDLKAIGIDATLQGIADQPPFFSKIDKGDFDIGFWWFCGATVDPVELYAGYECKDVVPIGELPKRGNSIRACDKDFDAVVEKLKAITPEDPAAHDLYMQAYDLWMKNAFGVPLVQTIYTQYYNTTYWDNMMSNSNLYTVPFNWWMQIQFLLYNIKPKGQ